MKENFMESKDVKINKVNYKIVDEFEVNGEGCDDDCTWTKKRITQDYCNTEVTDGRWNPWA